MERPAAEIDARDVAEDVARPEPFRLLLEELHQLGAENTRRESGVVLDVGGDGELAARLRALDDERLEIRARGVERGGESGRTRAENHDLEVGALRH